MQNTRKILLRSSELFGAENQDMFINLELKNSVKEFRPDSYENDFDLNKNFQSERNACRNFTIYGEIDSVFVDCYNVFVKIYKEIIKPTSKQDRIKIESTEKQGENTIVTLNNGAKATFITIQISKKMAYNVSNIFGFEKATYKFDLKNIDYETIYINMEGIQKNKDVIQDNFIRKQLVFHDSNNNLIPFGTDTEEINPNGTTYTVFNDFPFFYNIHWVKLPLEIIK